MLFPNKLGLTTPSKVTVVVRPEFYSAYTTPRGDDSDWSYDGWYNGWKYLGFNIVYEYPVFGVNFDVTRCFAKDPKLDISKVVSFLGDNVSKSTLDFSNQLFIAVKSTAERSEGVDAFDAGRQVKVYDNGKLLPDDRIADDGSVSLTYYNPNDLANKDLVGDHNIEVVYLCNVTFSCVSADLKIEPEIHNNENELGEAATQFEYFNYYDALAPVLMGVRENSQVRFRINAGNADIDQVRPVVKVGERVLAADEQGYYTVDVDGDDVNVNVYAVPVNGATLTSAEIAVIAPEEAIDVTALALSGEIDPEELKKLIDMLPALEKLDLSAMSESLPEGAMSGKETLTTVILPEASVIEANTFSGCTNLVNVVVPECVDVVGADAFNGCSSLESLSFSGIKSVGANAFKNCSRMTCILFSSARPDTAPARVSRLVGATQAEGYDKKAFDGLNPNCIVYLDEEVATPDIEGVNFVKARQNTASESGRVYEAEGDIVITPGYDFHAVNAFRINEENSISMEMTLGASDTGDRGWKSLVLPFSPSKVTDMEGNVMSLYADDAVSNPYGLCMVVSLGSDGTLNLADSICANTPYLAAIYREGGMSTVRFVAECGDVPQTPDEMRADGQDYALMAALSGKRIPTSGIYILSEDGSAFEAAETYAPDTTDADSCVTVAPFSVYAASDAGVPAFLVRVDIAGGITSGVISASDKSSFRIETEGNVLVVYSDCDTSVNVFNLGGQLVATLQLVTGRNVIDCLAPGVYIVRSRKVVL